MAWNATWAMPIFLAEIATGQGPYGRFAARVSRALDPSKFKRQEQQICSEYGKLWEKAWTWADSEPEGQDKRSGTTCHLTPCLHTDFLAPVVRSCGVQN